MSLTDGQKADATNINAAYLSKAIGGTTLGVIDLFNVTDIDSGPRITNVQRAVNEIFDAVGMTGLGDAGRKNYSSTTIVANGDDRKIAIGKLDAAIGSISTGLATKLDKPFVSTAFGVARFPDSSGTAIESSGVTVDASDNLDVPGKLTVHGDFEVDGTTTTVNTATLNVTAADIHTNVGGTDLSSEGSGLIIDRVSVKGSLAYKNSFASRFGIGDLGSEKEVADVSSIQTLINKVIDAASNTISNITDAAIAAAAAITRSKLAFGNANYVVINDGTGAMSEEQYLAKSRGGSGQSNSTLMFPTTGTIAVKEADGAFTIANNTLAQVVTGLIFAMGTFRSATVEWTVYRKSTGGGGQIRVQTGAFRIVHNDTAWKLTDMPASSDYAGVDFEIDPTSGQIEIDADDNLGTYSAPDSKLAYKIITTTGI